MRTSHALAAALLLPTLFGCNPADRTPPQERVELARIDPPLLQPCPQLKVGAIPRGDQELQVVFPLVRGDLENYVVCRYRHMALVAAITQVYAEQGAK